MTLRTERAIAHAVLLSAQAALAAGREREARDLIRAAVDLTAPRRARRRESRRCGLARRTPPVSGRLAAWVLPLDFTRPLSANDPQPTSRGARMRRNETVQKWRDAARQAATAAGVPELTLFTAVLEWRPGRNGRRDPENYFAAVKPLVDGLIDAGVAPDDTRRWYRSSTPIIHPAVKGEPASMWLTVIDLASEVGRGIHADLTDIYSTATTRETVK
jgi:crossover junction endodeoxyribonuclease RusA